MKFNLKSIGSAKSRVDARLLLLTAQDPNLMMLQELGLLESRAQGLPVADTPSQSGISTPDCSAGSDQSTTESDSESLQLLPSDSESPPLLPWYEPELHRDHHPGLDRLEIELDLDHQNCLNSTAVKGFLSTCTQKVPQIHQVKTSDPNLMMPKELGVQESCSQEPAAANRSSQCGIFTPYCSVGPGHWQSTTETQVETRIPSSKPGLHLDHQPCDNNTAVQGFSSTPMDDKDSEEKTADWVLNAVNWDIVQSLEPLVDDSMQPAGNDSR